PRSPPGSHASTPTRSGPRSYLAAILTRVRPRAVMPRLPLAPVLARTSQRSSLAFALGRSRRQPLTCRGDEPRPTGQVVSGGDVEESRRAGETLDGARRSAVVRLHHTA